MIRLPKLQIGKNALNIPFSITPNYTAKTGRAPIFKTVFNSEN